MFFACFRVISAIGVAIALLPGGVRAKDATIAVAANFSHAAEELATTFKAHSGHRVTITTGATGQLYAQIRNGAPFDLFLAADQRRPRLLGESGEGLAETQMTYAVGQLVLWSREEGRLAAGGKESLIRGDYRHLAIANPKLAPYGAAAVQAMKALSLYDRLKARIVKAGNIAQAHSLVATGNAELGFVALSTVMAHGEESRGRRWVVPRALYDPIRQDAILLRRGAENAAARGFLAFLKSAAGKRRIRSFGYAVE